MINKELEIEIISSKNIIDYHKAIEIMEKRVSDILIEEKNEMIWFLSHNHIYTCGRSADKKEILRNSNIPIIKTNRGGKTTYHGPGQRIIYLMFNLNKRKKDIRKFVSLVENSAISLLKEFNIESKTFPDRVGIWVTKYNDKILDKEKKIGAIGLRIKKWVTYHGLSFNINPDLSYYKNIHPCGLKDYSATSMKELNFNISEKKFEELFTKHFLEKIKNF